MKSQLTCNGFVALFSASGTDPGGQDFLARNNLRRPWFNGTFRGRRLIRLGTYWFRHVFWCEEHRALVHAAARKIDPVILCGAVQALKSSRVSIIWSTHLGDLFSTSGSWPLCVS